MVEAANACLPSNLKNIVEIGRTDGSHHSEGGAV